MADQLSIANRSLLAVGARVQISSLNPSDGSVEANAVSVLFQPTFEALGRAARWNCLRRQVTLSLITAASGTPENPNGTSFTTLPPVPWLYQYAYPSNCLSMQFIVPSYPTNTGDSTPPTTINNAAGTSLPSGGMIPYVVTTVLDSNNNSTLVILTNQEQAQAVYTVNQPNPSGWDSLFQAAMVASLGAFLVPALSLSLPLMDRCIKQAEMAIIQARTADGNEGVTSMDHLPDWMRARAGAGGIVGSYGYGFFNNGAYCYQDMSWPSYG